LVDSVPGVPQVVSAEDTREGYVVSVWDLVTCKPIHGWTNAPGAFWTTTSGEGKRALIFSLNGVVTIREIQTGREQTAKLRFQSLQGSTFSPDGRVFALATEPGFARFWDASTFEELATVKGHMLSVNSIAFSPDMRRFATGSAGVEAVKVWDYDSKLDLMTLPAEGNNLLERTCFSPDGNILAAVDRDGTLRLWRAPSWPEIEAIETARPKTQ
jgi:WD40 repeat protein